MIGLLFVSCSNSTGAHVGHVGGSVCGAYGIDFASAIRCVKSFIRFRCASMLTLTAAYSVGSGWFAWTGGQSGRHSNFTKSEAMLRAS